MFGLSSPFPCSYEVRTVRTYILFSPSSCHVSKTFIKIQFFVSIVTYLMVGTYLMVVRYHMVVCHAVAWPSRLHNVLCGVKMVWRLDRCAFASSLGPSTVERHPAALFWEQERWRRLPVITKFPAPLPKLRSSVRSVCLPSSQPISESSINSLHWLGVCQWRVWRLLLNRNTPAVSIRKYTLAS